jgi:hypothetical protein
VRVRPAHLPVLAVVLSMVFLLLGLVAAQARAQAVLATNGSSLQAPANLVLPGGANQCAARPYIGLNEGQITFIPTNQSTCMWWSTQYGATGEIVANTYVPRGAGAVIRVRVRSGDQPAPLRFGIVSSGSGFCCTTKQLSDQVQPVPNQVNQFAVNLPAGSGVGTQNGSQFNDILVVVAVGPGSLPVNDRGAHGFLFGSPINQAQASFLHPALALGASNTDVGIMDGYEVLLQYDWCGVPMTLGNPQPTAPADPQTACNPTPAQPTPPQLPQPPQVPIAPPLTAPTTRPLASPANFASVRDGRAALRLRCLLTTTCDGTLNLLARTATIAKAKKPKKPVSYGRATYKIAAGKTATIKVKLSKAGRSALRKKQRLPILVSGGSGASAWSLKLTLKR